jgi:hypothetical protein
MPRTKDDGRQLGTPCKDEAGFTCQALHKVIGCRSEILPAWHAELADADSIKGLLQAPLAIYRLGILP